MQQTGKKDTSKCKMQALRYASADGQSRVNGWLLPPAGGGAPRCVVQIAHGMCDYADRYLPFAHWLARRGIAVCAQDHIGHGYTLSPGGHGHLPKGGREAMLRDMHHLSGMARRQYPGVPLVLLGHSMGSFLARLYAARWPLQGLILSGTSGPQPRVRLGIVLADALAGVQGAAHPSELLRLLSFGGYLYRVRRPQSIYDWVSSDRAAASGFAQDPLCTFPFTVGAFGELYRMLHEAGGAGAPKGLPVLLLSGGDDPVGQYGRGAGRVARRLRLAGAAPVRSRVYPGRRHEVLNEVNRDRVYRDILRFLRAHVIQN